MMKAKTALRFALTHAVIAILPLAYADGEALVMSADGSISVDVREGDRRAVSPGAVCYSPMWGGIEQDGAYVALYKVTNVDAANPTTNEVARFSSDNEGEGSYSLFVGDEDEHCFRLIHRVYSPGGDEIGTPLVRDVAFGFESSEGEESVVDSRSNSLQLMQNSSGGVKLAYDTAWATNAASPLVLAKRGAAAEYAIVVAVDADECQRYAAEELRDYVKQLTDVELPIVTKAEDAAGATLPEKAIVLEVENRDSPDAFRLYADGQRLRIVGGGSRGVLYGVYELLETYGGIGWFSSWWTVVPRLEALSVPGNLDDVQKPAFAMRLASCPSPELAARLRLNGRKKLPKGVDGKKFGGPAHPSIGYGHTMNWLLPPKKYFAEHPEYFAEVNGVRVSERTQPCLTNPDVLRIVTSNVLAALRSNPTCEFCSVTQNDWNNWCTCEKCAAVDAEEESHAGTLVRFVNAVAEAVEKEFPNVKIQTFAYKYTQKPPKKTRLRHNVMLTMCTITADFSEPLAVSASAHNKRRNLAADMRCWAKQATEMFVWDYTVDFRNYLMPFPNGHSLLPNLRFFRDCGAKYVREQGYGGPGEFAELKAWLLAKGMWNPDVEEGPLLDRFFAGFYGAAAPAVREYFEALQQLPKTVGGVAETYTNGRKRKPVSDEFLAWATTNVWPRAEWAVRNDAGLLHNVRLAEASTVYARIMRLDPEKDSVELNPLMDWMVVLQREAGGTIKLCEGASKIGGNQPLLLERMGGRTAKKK